MLCRILLIKNHSQLQRKYSEITQLSIAGIMLSLAKYEVSLYSLVLTFHIAGNLLLLTKKIRNVHFQKNVDFYHGLAFADPSYCVILLTKGRKRREI